MERCGATTAVIAAFAVLENTIGTEISRHGDGLPGLSNTTRNVLRFPD